MDKFGLVNVIIFSFLLLLTIINLITISISDDDKNNKTQRTIYKGIINLVILISIMFILTNFFFTSEMKQFFGNNSDSTQMSIGIFSICMLFSTLVAYGKNWKHGMVITAFIWASFLSILGSNQVFNALKKASINNNSVVKLPVISGILQVLSGLLLFITGIVSS